MGAENADFRWVDLWVDWQGRTYGRSHAVIQAMNEARRKPREIAVEDLVPDNVRAYYTPMWQREQAELERGETFRVNCEQKRIEGERWASLWWWQKVRETVWPKR